MSLDGSWSPTKTPQGYTTSRKSIDCTSVPQTDDGLRTLAANGNWSGVLALAEKLEQEKAHQNGLEHLPYVLVRITVYFKTQQIPFAISLVELLGDVENSAHYRDPTTGENLVPFSLRYICGAIPHYAGETRKAIANLERLLSICKEEGKKIRSNCGAAAPYACHGLSFHSTTA
ncbi:hypothetical protein AGDE_09818 [Angomonas deanei]|uniref:Tetratricopeptide repeat n=1 Tax=Angomonas deanei TaxID=59799 RepID=A0A7G2CQJ1_9TRYP|nr:hypothetical protein AGDE_09818 [Angomonas deanei]CAD2221251.1 hypothetical protein, conserved [Angomonas deanei]|eukprot:EPY29793.1 hypothetical protein AGDE_09818 [Angomonas deanei]